LRLDGNVASHRLQRLFDSGKRGLYERGLGSSARGRSLYDPALDQYSCGVGFIADIKGRKSRKIVADALTILLNLEHRDAVGADPRAGHGARHSGSDRAARRRIPRRSKEKTRQSQKFAGQRVEFLSGS